MWELLSINVKNEHEIYYVWGHANLRKGKVCGWVERGLTPLRILWRIHSLNLYVLYSVYLLTSVVSLFFIMNSNSFLIKRKSFYLPYYVETPPSFSSGSEISIYYYYLYVSHAWRISHLHVLEIVVERVGLWNQ